MLMAMHKKYKWFNLPSNLVITNSTPECYIQGIHINQCHKKEEYNVPMVYITKQNFLNHSYRINKI